MPPILPTLLVAGVTDRDLHDAVVGDFIEEWHRRASTEGPSAANGWFWRQALRSLPYLTRIWWRAARASDIVANLGAIGAAYLAIFVIAAAVEIIGTKLLAIAGVPLDAISVRIAETVGSIVLVSIGGGVAARSAKRAPLVSTLGFGLSLFGAMMWATLTQPQVLEAHVLGVATVPAVLIGGLTVLTRSREPSVPNSERRRQ